MAQSRIKGRVRMSPEDMRETRKIRRQIGERIKFRRLALGIQITVLAENIGFAYQTIQKYEAGESEPSVLTMHKLARALNVPVTYFVEDEDEAEPTALLNGPEIAMLERFRSATPAMQDAVNILLTAIAKDAADRPGEKP